MAVHSVSSSFYHPNISSILSSESLNWSANRIPVIYLSYYITNILLLVPLCILILYLGLQRWWQQRSNSTATSHSDCFTYHTVTMQLFGVCGYIIGLGAIYNDQVNRFAGYYLWTFAWYGETSFHVLTCVEHYLAVIHPITYLSLKGERWIRLRNIIIGCVWLLCFARSSIIELTTGNTIIDILFIIFTMAITYFCSLSVLCVLIRSWPGKQGQDRVGRGQSKQRAFYIIMTILGALLMRGFWNLCWGLTYYFKVSLDQLLMSCGLWFNLPSSLVLPLLFLQRARELPCCKRNLIRIRQSIKS